MAFIHLVEVGVAEVIFDCIDNTAWVKTKEGIAKEVKITHITGLV